MLIYLSDPRYEAAYARAMKADALKMRGHNQKPQAHRATLSDAAIAVNVIKAAQANAIYAQRVAIILDALSTAHASRHQIAELLGMETSNAYKILRRMQGDNLVDALPQKGRQVQIWYKINETT